jgi:UDP-glucose 4-epimerase
MRVLVTGGAGYIGSVITEELIRAGHEAVVVDNLSTGYRAAVPEQASFVEADLMQGDALADILRGYSIEAVMHLAASALVGESVFNPQQYYRNNVEAGLSLLNAMCTCGIKRMIFSSTAAVYGEPEKQPIEETDSTQPSNPYGETKLAYEKALDWYGKAYGIRFTSLRYFNAAGATSDRGEYHKQETHLIPIALQAAAGRRDSVEIYGNDYPTRDGTCVRDYVHVVDLAQAHILALDRLDDRNHIYNLGCGGNGYSVKDVIEVARKVTGRSIPVRISGRRPGDPAVLIADSQRIRRDLGWIPTMQSLDSIIGSAWEWMQKHPDGY